MQARGTGNPVTPAGRFNTFRSSSTGCTRGYIPLPLRGRHTAPYHSTVKRQRRRTILKVLLLLIAGATLNVAVAWGFSAFEPLSYESGFSVLTEINEDSHWRVTGISALGHGLLFSVVEDSTRLKDLYRAVHMEYPYESRISFPHWARIPRVMPPDNRWWTQRVAGWPLFALWNKWDVNTEDGSHQISGGISLSYAPFTPDDVYDSLPLVPLWPGFAINTLFYAGVLWMLFRGPFALRRMIRKRRGHCPACNYPIGQSPVCTECGAAVPSVRVTSSAGNDKPARARSTSS